MNAASDQGTLEIGGERRVEIMFSPTASVAEGLYTFYLRVESNGEIEAHIGLHVSVTLSGIGGALFKITDIYTGTPGPDAKSIQGVSGARIMVQNEEVPNIEMTLDTDAAGEALFEDLAAGRYKYRITADKHQQYIGRLRIKPGVTVNTHVFLEYTLITVEWSVKEITIEDRYEIVLDATYETDVPAPVLAIEPMLVNMPPMRKGDVFRGEFTITNLGLVRADELRLRMPPENDNFRYEALALIPDSLGAKERLTIPWRVVCLSSLPEDDHSKPIHQSPFALITNSNVSGGTAVLPLYVSVVFTSILIRLPPLS